MKLLLEEAVMKATPTARMQRRAEASLYFTEWGLIEDPFAVQQRQD